VHGLIEEHNNIISGMDLGILEWWGCKNNARESLKPRPFNENHAIFNCF
jgi:hypothetical protein